MFLYFKAAHEKSHHSNVGQVNPDDLSSSIDNVWNALYCVVLAIWSTIMIEMWKRKESEIAHLWNMKGYIGNDSERVEYRSEYVICPETHHYKKETFSNAYLRRIFVELPTIISAIGIFIGVYYAYYRYMHSHTSMVSSLVSAAIYAIVIILLGTTYKAIANLLATWENHRFQQEWENSLITKVFSFQFVNSYIALFAFAFAEQNFNTLAYNVAIFIIVKQIAMNLVEVFIPIFT